jgi:hypothetical protein
MPRRTVVLLGLAVALLGCAVEYRREDLQAWVGRPVAALRQEWGAPTREVQDDGLRIVIYEQLERNTPRSFTNPAPRARDAAIQDLVNEGARGPTVYVRSYLFWVNAEGAIIRADVRQP